MKALDTAILKDSILEYLGKHSENLIDLDIIKKDLKLYSIPEGVLIANIEELLNDAVVINGYSMGGYMIQISNKGQKLLIEGGYSKDAEQLEEDRLIGREKTRLEIQNLKLTKWLSIIALIISFIALAVSIFK